MIRFKMAVLLGVYTVPLVIGLMAWVIASPAQGIYSAEQAIRGKKEFYSYCASCHDEQIFKNSIKQRKGQPVVYLFEEIITTMPMNAPGFLRDEYYEDIFAYILESAGLPVGTTDLTYEIMKDNEFSF
jgi:mono/diheme cytochrome c family protein